MDIKRAFKNERLLRALTGISKKEFTNLLIQFEKLFLEIVHRQKRERAYGGGRHGVLKGMEEKLFFILFYLKVYPTYDVASFLFDVDRAQPCRWVKKLLRILEGVLGRECVLPKKQIKSVEDFLREYPTAKDLFIDCTECRTERPKSAKNQKRRYSGKKKSHTRKHLLITDYKKRVLFVSSTKNGRRHDKYCLDKTGLMSNIPSGTTLWVDTGFCGIEKQLRAGVTVMRPAKRTKNKPLTQAQKRENQEISSLRMVVENAISGIKRFNTLAHIFRNKHGQDDQFFLVASGLWNFHLQFSS